MSYLRVIGGLTLYPEKYVKMIIHEDRSIAEPLFTTIFFQAILSIGYTAMINNIFRSVVLALGIPIPPKLIDLFIPIIIPIAIVSGLIIWVLWSAVTHIIARLLGGVGEYTQILKAMGYTWFTLIIPIIPILTYPASPIASLAATPIFTLISIGWMIYINHHFIKEIYGLSGGEALLTLLLPILIIIILSITLPLLSIVFIPRG